MAKPGLNLDRLLRPRSIAVVGGSWGRSVVEQCARMQFDGQIWPVHPKHDAVLGYQCYRSIAELPAAPDATFVGVNRHLTVELTRELAAAGAGGAVCFASGFSEAAAEDASGVELQQQLLEAAGTMPIVGPNCYGLINYLDGALLWPDQHGGRRVDSGVAIITQSSNIAISMTMQRRGLPLAYVMTAGNQAQVTIASMAMALLDDPRVTCIGLHVEGFSDYHGLQQLADKAHAKGIGIVVIKAGRSEQAQAAMVSHTNSLSGTDASSSALIERLGFARVFSIPSFLESLKLLHSCGMLRSNKIASMSCSGGEASIMADAIGDRPLEYPPLSTQQRAALREALGPMVALANPLDYHTYIWNDLAAMTATFTAMLQTPADLTFLVIDFPRNDICEDDSWWVAIDALIAARDATGASVALVATMPENLPESLCVDLMQKNIPSFGGIDEALDAVVASSCIGKSKPVSDALLQSEKVINESVVLAEYESKKRLQQAGVPVATVELVSNLEQAIAAAAVIGYPLVIKVSGIAHKTEQGGVVLGVQSEDQLQLHAERLLKISDALLIEPYYQHAVAELLVGVVREPDGLFKLTIGAGGVLTELIRDTASLLLPVSSADIQQQLKSLRVAPVLNGYRGQAAADMPSIVDAIHKLCEWVVQNADHVCELEINPLLCLENSVVVVDALITSSSSFPKSV